MICAMVLSLAFPAMAEPTKGHVPTNMGTLVSLNEGEQTFVEYRFSNDDFKPYVQVLRSPGGINVLRDRPYDHLHHRGLMFAVNMNHIEFWGQGWSMGSLGQQIYDAESLNLDTKTNSLTGDLSWNSLEFKRALSRNTVRSSCWIPTGSKPPCWHGNQHSACL